MPRGASAIVPTERQRNRWRWTAPAPVYVTPEQDASGGKAIFASPPAISCAAEFVFDGASDWYILSVEFSTCDYLESQPQPHLKHDRP